MKNYIFPTHLSYTLHMNTPYTFLLLNNLSFPWGTNHPSQLGLRMRTPQAALWARTGLSACRLLHFPPLIGPLLCPRPLWDLISGPVPPLHVSLDPLRVPSCPSQLPSRGNSKSKPVWTFIGGDRGGGYILASRSNRPCTLY